MKTPERSQKLFVALGVLIAGIFGAGLFVLTFISPIQGMKVYVLAPTNPPPRILAMASTNNSISTNGWTIRIPFEDATNKFVSETDIVQIKQAIPWNKTTLHLYFPQRIVVNSPTNAYAEFSRKHIVLHVYLEKRDDIWQVEHLFSTKWDLHRSPDLQERIAESLPR
jgi:hypothetical protein